MKVQWVIFLLACVFWGCRHEVRTPKSYHEGVVERGACDTWRQCQSLAEGGNTEAQRRLAEMYLREGEHQDEVKAMKWMKKAAQRDHPEAQFALGKIYYEGRGIAQDEEEAVKWWKEAAKQGHEEAKAVLEKLKK